MIFYGTRTRHKSTHAIPGPCPHCETEGSVELNIFQRYAHFFWIPVFPIGRIAETDCSHCKEVRSGKHLQPSAQQLYNELVKEDRTPIWMFSGSFIILILIPLAFWQSGRNDVAVRELLRTPKVGDVYEISLDDRRYTLYKVADVLMDSVTVLLSNKETNKLRGLYSIEEEGDAAYDDERASFSLSDLQKMRDDDVIFSVKR